MWKVIKKPHWLLEQLVREKIGHSVVNKPYQDGIANINTGRKKYQY
ncbi:hypothetical protein [Lysinibacillus capsici]|nr:hypothetical protein [Lysinibacillus capsici]